MVGSAVVDVVAGVGLPLWLSVEEQPGLAGAYLREVVAVGGGGVAFSGGAQGVEGWEELGVGGVAQGGGAIKGRPGRDGDGAGLFGSQLCVVAAAVLNDVEDEEADDDGEKDEVAGAELHKAECRG